MAPVRQTLEQDEFLAMLCADEELLRAEFEAIIEASWDEPAPPARPKGRPGPPPDRAGRRDGATVHRQRPHPLGDASARQRSPPCGVARTTDAER